MKIDGKEQVRRYAALVNSEQKAPASAKWQPDELAGFRVGDSVHVPTLGRCLVIALLPPALLQVTTESGGIAKVGWKACSKVSK